MRKTAVFMTLVLALCLAWGAAPAEEGAFAELAGTWYTEEIDIILSEDGRFVIEWFDGDWTGSLEPETRINEEGDEYAAYRMILDDPEEAGDRELELVPDIYHPGKMQYFVDGSPREVFWNVPVYVMEMDPDEEELEVYEPYYRVEGAAEEDGPVTLMFTLLRPATDIAVMRMSNQSFDEYGDLSFSAETLEWWPELDSQERVVVTWVFEGDLPDLAFCFKGEDEESFDFGVVFSGYDGEMELMRLPASNG